MGVREGGGHAFTTHKVPSTSLHDQTFCIEQGATDHVGLRVLRILLMIRNAYNDLIIVQSNTLQRSLQAFLLDAESLIVEQSGGIEDGACMPVLSLHFECMNKGCINCKAWRPIWCNYKQCPLCSMEVPSRGWEYQLILH